MGRIEVDVNRLEKRVVQGRQIRANKKLFVRL